MHSANTHRHGTLRTGVTHIVTIASFILKRTTYWLNWTSGLTTSNTTVASTNRATPFTRLSRYGGDYPNGGAFGENDRTFLATGFGLYSAEDWTGFGDRSTYCIPTFGRLTPEEGQTDGWSLAPFKYETGHGRQGPFAGDDTRMIPTFGSWSPLTATRLDAPHMVTGFSWSGAPPSSHEPKEF